MEKEVILELDDGTGGRTGRAGDGLEYRGLSLKGVRDAVFGAHGLP